MRVELKPDIEAGLLAQAHARGLPLEAYVDEAPRRAAAPQKPRSAGGKVGIALVER